MQSGNKAVLAGCGVLSLLLAALPYLVRRYAEVCIVEVTPPPISIVSVADKLPQYMLALTIVSAVGVLGGAFYLILAFVQKDAVDCPHCGKSVEPKWTATGRLVARVGRKGEA